MLTWIGFIGPGLALMLLGYMVLDTPGMESSGKALGMIGVLYLMVVGPIYSRRRRARLQARNWFDRERYKEPFRARLPRARKR